MEWNSLQSPLRMAHHNLLISLIIKVKKKWQNKKNPSQQQQNKNGSRKQESMSAHFLATGPIWNLKRNLILPNTQRKGGKEVFSIALNREGYIFDSQETNNFVACLFPQIISLFFNIFHTKNFFILEKWSDNKSITLEIPFVLILML